MNYKNIFITGKAGCGKTNIIKESTLPFRDIIAGFYTEDVESEGKKTGFKIVTFSGMERIFAGAGIKIGPKVSKYKVNVGVFDGLACEELKRGAGQRRLLVVDEIGSMELLSKNFGEILVKCINGPCSLLATVRDKSKPYSSEITKLSDSKVIELTKDNYADTKAFLRKWIEELIKQSKINSEA